MYPVSSTETQLQLIKLGLIINNKPITRNGTLIA